MHQRPYASGKPHTLKAKNVHRAKASLQAHHHHLQTPKTLQVGLADTDLESRAMVKRKFLGWKPTDIKPSTRVISELCIQTHWRSRRTGVLAAAEIGEERQATPERERQRWTTKTFSVLVEAKQQT